MAKELCKSVKNGALKKKPEEFIKKITDATFYCKSCGRVANDSKFLCKPVKLK